MPMMAAAHDFDSTAYAKAVLNVLEDFAAEKEQLRATQSAILNVLDDLAAEREQLERSRREVLRSEQALRASLREKEVLLKEVHHRVKNNLQVISSLINMQMRQMDDGEAKDALFECKTRVEAIALIHEKLYQSKDYANVPFSKYVGDIVTNIFEASGIPSDRIALHVDIEPLQLGVDKAIPCGLILNELLTNAVKHAFPAERRGAVYVSLANTNGAVCLTVRDDGVGLPANFDAANSKSLGLQLVSTLVEQLGGHLEITSGAGAVFRVTFPKGAE